MARPNDYLYPALLQAGDPYVLGAEASKLDANPRRFDCSELTEWACGRAGVFPVLPDGAWFQKEHCRRHGTLISVADGIRTKGALLFVAKGLFASNGGGNHVAFSLGDGRTIEARGRKYGVGVFNANGRSWTHAARIPGVDYSAVSHPSPGPTPPPVIDWNALKLAVAAAKRTVLRAGDSGPAVKFLQEGLNRVSGRGLKVDGQFGPATHQAVVDLQRWLHLTVDGIVGPQVWGVLYP